MPRYTFHPGSLPGLNQIVVLRAINYEHAKRRVLAQIKNGNLVSFKEI